MASAQAGARRSLACAGVLTRGARRGRQFNNSRHEYEIFLENSSVLEPCADEDAASIPKMLYHVRPPPSPARPGAAGLLPGVRRGARGSSHGDGFHRQVLHAPGSEPLRILRIRLTRVPFVLAASRGRDKDGRSAGPSM
jgi:hypothetical protein